MRSSAAVAVSSVVAATAATGSPTKRTVCGHSACSSWLTGRIPNAMGRSWPVSTAFTPAKARALLVSMPVMRACGCGLRSSLQNNMRGRARSSANFVAPVTLATASTLRRAVPIMRVRRLDGWTVGWRAGRLSVEASKRALRLPAIEALPRRLRPLAPHSCRRQLHRLVDLDVAGAAAKVAGERLLDLVSRRLGIGGEQGLGREQKCGRAVATLRCADLGECVLQRVQARAVRHALDGLHAPARAREPQHETGQYGEAVHQDGARAAFAQLATVLGAGEAQVLPQHFEQRLGGGEADVARFAVQIEAHAGKPKRSALWRPSESPFGSSLPIFFFAATPTHTPAAATTPCAGGSRTARAPHTARDVHHRPCGRSGESSLPRAPPPRSRAATPSPRPRPETTTRRTHSSRRRPS